ncbi:MAG: ArnT family glycosyltransferase [Thermoflexales bacterium]
MLSIPRFERKGAALVGVFAFLLFSFYSALTPLFEASDELWHYPLVRHFATGGGLPVQRAGQTDAEAPWRQEGSQPPLYYWVAAALSAPFDSSRWRVLRRINPHSDMGVPTRDGNANTILHTPQEATLAPEVLAVRAARLASILMSVVSVAFAYLVACELFPPLPHDRRTLLRLAIPLIVTCTPMFAFISGSINNDNAAVMFCTIGTWWALRAFRMGDLSLRSAALAGVMVGLGALSKSSALGLIGLFMVAALLVAVRQRTAWCVMLAKLTRFAAMMLAVAFALSGWWFVRNIQLYGDWLGWNAFLDVVGRRDQPASLAQLWSEREGFVWAYWGVFGAMNVIMSPWIYDALNLLVALATLGNAVALLQALRRRALDAQAVGKLVLGGLWVVLVFVALLRWTSLTPASQGRLMFPTIAMLSAFIGHGLWRIHRAALLGGVGAMVALAIAAPLAFIAPAYAAPPDRWQRPLAEPLDARFGGYVRLVSAQSDAEQVTPGQAITLQMNWELLSTPARNYSVFVHLLDEHDVIVAQRDMYPGQGSLALSELPPGRRWSDHYTLRIPALAHAPRLLRWAVGLYDLASGERLTLPDGDDQLVFGRVRLNARAEDVPLLRYTNGLTLLGYALDPPVLRRGEVLRVTTRWYVSSRPPRDLALSLQLLDDFANKAAQHDARHPISRWAVGETLTLTHLLAVGEEVAAGVYRLLLVWYAPEDFARLGAYDAQGQFAGDQITLTRLRLH